MDEATLAKYRADVIRRSINLEWILNVIISQNYFHTIHGTFIFEVLYDPGFNLRLKINIVSKMKRINKKMIAHLHEIADVRNVFAHFDPNFIKPTGEEVAPDPKNLQEQINFQEKYKKFIELEGKVLPYLWQFLKDLGVKAETTKKLK